MLFSRIAINPNCRDGEEHAEKSFDVICVPIIQRACETLSERENNTVLTVPSTRGQTEATTTGLEIRNRRWLCPKTVSSRRAYSSTSSGTRRRRSACFLSKGARNDAKLAVGTVVLDLSVLGLARMSGTPWTCTRALRFIILVGYPI